MHIHRVTAFYLVTQLVCIKYCINASETKPIISNIFEGFGYSPSCVAKCLGACEQSAKSSFEKVIVDSLTTIVTILNQTKSENILHKNCVEAKVVEPEKEQPENCTDNKVVGPEKEHPKSCVEIKAMGDNKSGVRTIYPNGHSVAPIEVFCDQTTDGGGWIVFQNRDNLTVREDFFRSWNDYVTGFGNLTGEFWLGLDKILALVSLTKMELRVDLESYEGAKRWAKYSLFSIGDSSTKYKLNIGGFTGDAGDGFGSGRHNGRKFTTKDQDNDEASTNCANLYKGGWWYDNCHISNLNGFPFAGSHASYADGINWKPWGGYNYSFKKASMKVRSQ